MNFREGMRRVGLTCGLVGLCTGLLASTLEYERLSSRSAEADRWKVATKENRAAHFNRDYGGDYVILSKAPVAGDVVKEQQSKQIKLPPGADPVPSAANNWFKENAPPAGRYKQSEITSQWTPPGLDEIQPQIEESFYSEPEAPTVMDWGSLLAWPLLGFLTPWSLVKLIVWLVNGFTKA